MQAYGDSTDAGADFLTTPQGAEKVGELIVKVQEQVERNAKIAAKQERAAGGTVNTGTSSIARTGQALPDVDLTSVEVGAERGMLVEEGQACVDAGKDVDACTPVLKDKWETFHGLDQVASAGRDSAQEDRQASG